MATTLIHPANTFSGKTQEQTEKSSAFWEKLEYNRWGVNMIILFVCMICGGIAGAFSLNMGDVTFALILAASMFTLVMVLSLAPMRVLVTVAIVNVIIAASIIAAGVAIFGGLQNP